MNPLHCFCKYYKVFRSPQLLVSNELVAECNVFVWLCLNFFLMKLGLFPHRRCTSALLWTLTVLLFFLRFHYYIVRIIGDWVSVCCFSYIWLFVFYLYYFKNTFVQRQCRRTYICVHIFEYVYMYVCMYVDWISKF